MILLLADAQDGAEDGLPDDPREEVVEQTEIAVEVVAVKGVALSLVRALLLAGVKPAEPWNNRPVRGRKSRRGKRRDFCAEALSRLSRSPGERKGVLSCFWFLEFLTK